MGGRALALAATLWLVGCHEPAGDPGELRVAGVALGMDREAAAAALGPRVPFGMTCEGRVGFETYIERDGRRWVYMAYTEEERVSEIELLLDEGRDARDREACFRLQDEVVEEVRRRYDGHAGAGEEWPSGIAQHRRVVVRGAPGAEVAVRSRYIHGGSCLVYVTYRPAGHRDDGGG